MARMFERMNAAYRTRFPKDPPARATVITPLVSPDFGIEITLVAAKGGGRTAMSTPNADGSPGRANPNLSSADRRPARSCSCRACWACCRGMPPTPPRRPPKR